MINQNQDPQPPFSIDDLPTGALITLPAGMDKRQRCGICMRAIDGYCLCLAPGSTKVQ